MSDQTERAHRFGELLCELIECEPLCFAGTENMPAALLRKWQEATDEHIDSTGARAAQPAAEQVSDAQLTAEEIDAIRDAQPKESFIGKGWLYNFARAVIAAHEAKR